VGDLRLVLRGMWFRRGLSLAVLVLASLVVGGAVTGPLFLRSAGESVLRDTLDQALPVGRIVSDQWDSTVHQQPLVAVERLSAANLKSLPTLRRLLAPPVASLDLSAVVGSGITADPTPFVYRADVCAHLHMVQGRCAEEPGSVMVSATSAGLQRWSVGGPLLIDGIRVTIAGIYAPLDPTGDYWPVTRTSPPAPALEWPVTPAGPWTPSSRRWRPSRPSPPLPPPSALSTAVWTWDASG
jgi:putative ABC transport system permease protein